MAVQAENIWFESMGFGPFVIQDCFMGSVLGIEDGFCFQEQRELYPLVYSYDSLASSSSISCCGSLPVEIIQSLSSDLEKQMVEIDWFLQLENKRLRRSILQEETRQQAVIMQKYESSVKTLMLQKDEELATARNKARELQNFMKVAEMEAKAWEKKATENEAIVSDLKNRLNQVKEKDCLFPNAAAQEDDAVSFCDSSSSGKKRGLEEQNSSKEMGCKLCQARSLCVVFFPCRHLCCCKSCEALLGHCPVCQTVKEASLEVSLV